MPLEASHGTAANLANSDFLETQNQKLCRLATYADEGWQSGDSKQHHDVGPPLS